MKIISFIAEKRKNNKFAFAFCSLVIGFFILSLCYMFFNHGTRWELITFDDQNDFYMDFFHCITHSNYGHPYSLAGTIYPPLAYVIYGAISLFIPYEVKLNGAHAIRNSYAGQNMFMLYNIAVLFGLCFALYKLIKNKKIRNIVIISIIISNPFIFCFQRANIIIVSLIFAALFFAYKDSENKYLREFALISLAISAGIKIYPALFGLVLIKEKKYKEAFRCCIYGALMFIIPFMLMGGISTIKPFIHNITSGVSDISGITHKYKLNFASTISFILNISESKISTFMYLLLPLSIVPLVKMKKSYLFILLITVLMIGIPGVSFVYTMVFMAIPIIMLLNESEKEPIDYFFLLLMTMCMCSFGFLDLTVKHYNVATFIEGVLLILLFILCYFAGTRDFINSFKSKKK